MATTIKLKNGTGVPSAGSLVVGEPALDLTNKRLYTEDSGGTVIEVGTNPGTDVTFADNRKAIFGAGSDLQIYHDGYHSNIKETGAGSLIIDAANTIFRNADATKTYALMADGGAVDLYHNNALKLATTATGIDVTGTVTADAVGIGTDSPVSSLDLSGGADGTIGVLTLAQGNTTTKVSKIYGTSTNTNEKGIKFNTQYYGDVDAMTISPEGNVGIGTDSPSSYPVAPELVVDADTSGGITVKTGITGYGGVFFADGTTGNEQYRGFVQYNHNNGGSVDELLFGTSGATAMRINSSGNVLINRTSTSGLGKLNVEGGADFTAGDVYLCRDSGNLLVGTTDTTLFNNTTGGGFHVAPSGFTEVAYESANAADPAFLVNNTGADGDIIQLRKDGTTVGSIGAKDSNLFIGTGDTGVRFSSGTDSVFPIDTSTGNGRDASIDLGLGAGGRFKDLYLSGNINASTIISSGGRNSLDLQAESGGIGRVEAKGAITVADDATVTLTDAECGALLVHVYDNGTGDGAVFFANYYGGTVIIQAVFNSNFATSDTDGKYCLFKSTGSHTLTFKNRTGSAQNMSFMVVGAQAAKS